MAPLRQFIEFSGSERAFAALLHNYRMTHQEMFDRGYPTKLDQDSDFVMIQKNTHSFPIRSNTYDSNSGECGSRTDTSYNSEQDSQRSSTSGEYYYFIHSNTSYEDTSKYSNQNQMTLSPVNVHDLMKTCIRCSEIFYITTDYYITLDKCFYHWGKLQSSAIPGEREQYDCCQREEGDMGCSVGRFHVWSGLVDGINGLYSDYVFTKPQSPLSGNDHGVFALDCEMCYTVKGLDVTKVTMVRMDGRLVYESYVKPDHEIVDYNTRFSGVTASDMTRRAVKNIREVQNDLMGIISADTILIGHGLENDLRALKIVHGVIVDTAHVFPHFKGYPFRRSLKNLTLSILDRKIQSGVNGHNSCEDASACMELMLWRVKEDFGILQSHH